METANYLSTRITKGSYEEALVWAQKMHSALVDGDCEVVCYWSLFFDKKGEALIYCPKSEARNYEITPKYYTSMNFFRFIRPGMIRCSACLFLCSYDFVWLQTNQRFWNPEVNEILS